MFVRVLGLFDDHNASCSVVEDGRILAAIEEERLSRIKFHNGTTEDGPPRLCLAKVMEMTGSQRSNIDRIAIAMQPPMDLIKYVLHDLFSVQAHDRWIYHSMFSKSIRWDKYFLFYPYWYNWNRIKNVKKLLKEVDLDGVPIDFVHHHTAHAASAYYTSGKDNVLAVSLDGQGDGLAGGIYKGVNGEIETVATVPSFHSIGLFYNFITWMLGFRPNRHEGKITGLAAYGDADKTRHIFREFFRMNGPEFQYLLSKKIFQHAYPHRSNYPKLLQATNEMLKPFSPEDIAAGVQILAEESVQTFVKHYVDREVKAGAESVDVVMAGGLFANVKINQRVAELPHVNSVFIFPAMGDGGLSAGAALHSYYQHFPEDRKEIKNRRIPNVYLGPDYTEKEIESSLSASGLEYKRYDNIEEEIGKLLSKGRIIARFNGRMEFGPRALGNRSILYQPTDPTVNDWLNKKLKRTEFMPFAPSSLREDAPNLYKNVDPNYFPAEFMTITFDCTSDMEKKCRAVVHVDCTARPQLVSPDINESYYKIIKAYHKRTKLSTIINTSFNMHEEPIVCSPDDAIRAFKLGHLETLALGNFLIESPEATERK